MIPIRQIAALLPLLVGAFFAADLVAQGHPHFDDGGTLQWSTKFAEAKVAAKQQDKLVFVEYGRKACSNCRALVERALPNPEVKSRLSAIAIGLAADCDSPDGGIDELMHQGLPGATGLPFVAILTPDGQWIDGFSGYRDAKELAEFLDRAAKSPLLEAPAAVRKQLEKLATAATAAATRADWKPVLAAAREADKSSGRCPERTAIKAAEQRAREWLAAQYDAVFQAAATGADLAPARQRLADVKRHFAGEPEALDADTGTKALQRLKYVREIEANPNPARDLRERSAAMFPGTRWTALFAKATAPAGGQEKAPTKAPD